MGFLDSSGTFKVNRPGASEGGVMERAPKLHCFCRQITFWTLVLFLWPYGIQLHGKGSYIHNASVAVLG